MITINCNKSAAGASAVRSKLSVRSGLSDAAPPSRKAEGNQRVHSEVSGILS